MNPLIIIITWAIVIIFFALTRLFKMYNLKYGNQYIVKLRLRAKEISHLNSLNIPLEGYPVDFYSTELLRIYISTIRKYPELIKKKILKKEQNLTLNYCIWQVRCTYNYKVSKFKMPAESIKAIPAGIKAFIDSLAETLPVLDEEQEKILSYNDSTRWKMKFEQLTQNYKKDNETFYNEILQLASCFDFITTKRAIYHHAHLFMADKNRESSAIFYIHYLNVKSQSTTFKYTGINAKNKKLLFRDKKQEAEFEQIIENLKADNDLGKALKATEELFTIKRKTIQLNIADIDKAQQEYNMAIGILNEYLADEEIPEPVTKVTPPLPDYLDNTKKYQEEFLELFVLNNYKLDKKEVDVFAEKQGIFASQLVNNINEIYYDELNDVLIEESDDYFTVNETYYRRI